MTPPAPQNVTSAVVMACDAGYAPYAMVLAQSIFASHPARDFDVIIFSQDAITLPPALAAAGLRVEGFARANPYTHGPHMGRHGADAFLRLLLPEQLAARYARILYLDSDILCMGPDLGRLLKTDMKGHALAAVRDNTQWRTPNRLLPEFRAMKRSARPYFNSGVLLIDTAAWMAAGIGAECEALFARKAQVMTRHDQSLLNIVADGKFAELSPVWNWQYTWSSRFFADLAGPKLVHFIGARKPWKDVKNQLPARFRAPYAAMAEQGPSPFDLAKLDHEAPAWPTNLRKSFLKHWWAAPAMAAYLARFPDPYVAQDTEGGNRH